MYDLACLLEKLLHVTVDIQVTARKFILKLKPAMKLANNLGVPYPCHVLAHFPLRESAATVAMAQQALLA